MKKIIGYVLMFVIWGLCSLDIIPVIAKVGTVWQIVATIIWIGTLFGGLLIVYQYEIPSRKRIK